MATKKKTSKKRASKKRASKKNASRKTPAKKKSASKKKASTKKPAPAKPEVVREVGGQTVKAPTEAEVNKAVEKRIKGKTVIGERKITMLNPKNIVVLEGFNPRIDMGDMAALMNSIKRNGVKVPITVRKVGKHFELINGHRRLVATLKLGLDRIPAIVEASKMSAQEALSLALVTNDSKTLAPVEEAEAFRRLVSQGWTPKQIHVATGKSLRLVKDRLSLISAHPDVAAAVKSGKLSVNVGVAIAKKVKGRRSQGRKARAATKSTTTKKKVAASVGKATLKTKFDKKKVALQNRLNKLVDMVNKKLKKADRVPTTLSSQINYFSKHPNKEVRAAYVAGGVVAITDVMSGIKPAKAPAKRQTARPKAGKGKKKA